MKKVIITVLTLAICISTVLSFVSCGKKVAIGKEYAPSESQLNTLVALNAKTADVSILDSVMAGYYMSQDTKFSNSLQTVDNLVLATEQYGIAARKGSAIMYYINKTLVELLNDGTVYVIAEEYGLSSEVSIDKNYSTDELEDKSDWEYVKGQGKVIIGYTLYAPVAFEEEGVLKGFDIDLAKAVFAKLGLDVEFTVIAWETKEAMLEAKTIDLIWNGLTITEERQEKMEISIPYLNNKQVAVIRKEDADLYTDVESMVGAIMTAEAGSAGEDIIKGDTSMSFGEITLKLLRGFGYTASIFFITLILALPLGLLIAFGSMSKFKPLAYLIKGIIWVVRGTPLMLQIIVFAYGPGLWLGIPIRTTFGKLLMVCIAFVINYACYMSEVYRGGIQSVPVGQYEACQVLGMTKHQAFGKVVLLQTIKRIVPPMSNEIITLIKDTSLASVVISVDIIYEAKTVANVVVDIWPLFYAGLFYLIFNGIVTVLLRRLENKLSYFKV